MKIAELFEGRMDRLNNSWALLPATKALFNKVKVSKEEIAKEMGSHGSGSGTILVCERVTNSYPPKKSIVFLSSSGDMSVPIGKQKEAHHDQSLSSLGTMTVLNVIHYKREGKGDDAKFTFNLVNKTHENEKAPVYVFK